MWAIPACTTTRGASRQLFSASQPMNFDPSASRASSLTSVPAGKNALLHTPEVEVAVNVQSIPAGWEVTRPDPVPPRAREMLPLEDWNWVTTVSVEPLETPPAVPIMVDDWLLVTGLVVTVKLARVAPAGTVTDAGTVAAAVLLLDNATLVPPVGAALVRLAVPVTDVPPTTVVWLNVSELIAGGAGEVGGDVVAVQPDSLATAAVVDPSLTSTVQSAGALNPDLSTLKRPEASEVPMATPSTVIVRAAAAVPSIRKEVP